MVAFGQQSYDIVFASSIGNVISYFDSPFFGTQLAAVSKLNATVLSSNLGVGRLYFVSIKSGPTVVNGYVNSDTSDNAVATLIANQPGEQQWSTQQVLYYGAFTNVN